MKKVRVLVANRPRLMRELVLATISDQPDIEIVGELQDDAEIVELVEKLHPDFLIIAQDEAGRRPSICDFALERYPHLKILALAPERNYSVFYWAALDIRSDSIEASEESVLKVLRGQKLPAGGKL